MLSLQPSLLQVEHAKEVVEMGEELDVMDLAVLCAARKFEVFVAHDWPSDTVIPFRRLRDYVVELHPPCEAVFGVDNKDALTWVVILCNAFYDPKGPTNHFVPAYTAEELGDDQFEQLKECALADTDARIEELRVGCEMDVETDEDLALRNDYQITWQHVKSWRAFQERCYKSKIHPVEVLGDGNCMLWSLKCLKDDDISGKNTMKPKKEDYKILKKWRQQLHDQWIALSTDEDWQTLFNQLYVQSDDPLQFEAAAEQNQHEKNDAKIKKEPCRSRSPKRRLKPKSVEAAAPAPESAQPPAESEGDPQKKHKRVAACRPASCFQSGPKEPLKLQQPQRKVKVKVSKQAAQDDSQKDTEKDPKSKGHSKKDHNGKGEPQKDTKGVASGRKRSKKNQDPGESAQAEETVEDVEVPEISETETVVVAEPTRTRVRKKAKTARELRLRALRTYLGERGVTYPAWMGAHWRHNHGTMLQIPLHLNLNTYIILSNLLSSYIIS